MLEIIVRIALLCCSLSMLGLIYRVIKGPSTADRVIALDSIGVNLVAITALFSIVHKSTAFLDIILLIGILAFIGTVAFAKYLERGEIIENEPNR
ncbi:cation:proton antiporter [Bacillus sp. FJAT-18017]|jgi:multicomponent Na+:H+ antiporter subunit F|uniref:Na(+)/H(+) antiporter subunit F1 n=1 Tax=unclassified Bacillus (in: firmicutes) TaxID=185979 RepID=UPI0005C701B2|nr:MULTISPECIES: Na(+)/H(+) antiporter subunit F1 [unclassified Bacillus (in: firmicutes)]ALC88954.1 cation:proton antiporter [Bacillus sp. FJAT-18017]